MAWQPRIEFPAAIYHVMARQVLRRFWGTSPEWERRNPHGSDDRLSHRCPPRTPCRLSALKPSCSLPEEWQISGPKSTFKNCREIYQKCGTFPAVLGGA